MRRAAFSWLSFARRPGSLAAGLSIALTLIAAHYGPRAVGGADEYGYASQAELWLEGRLTIDQSFVRQVPWPYAERSFAPLGYHPHPRDRGTLVPTYSPGLPMLLAELFGDGQDAYENSSVRGARERTYLRAHQKCYDDLPRMLSANVRASIADQVLECELTPLFADRRWSQFVATLMAINLSFKGAFHILHKVDAVSAPFGVRPRSPLFDRAVVELAFRLPSQLKLRGSIEKYLLKEAVRDVLPAAIIDRPKSGMLVPVEAWFKGPLLPHARERLLDGLTQYGLFDRAYLERLLTGRLPGLHPRRGVKIWMLVTLESWLRSVGVGG